MIALAVALGTIATAFVWSDYSDDPNAPTNFLGNASEMNEWGEVYNPATGTWAVPEPLIPEIGLNERGENVLAWTKDFFSLDDQKKAIRNYALLALVLYTKPWK